METMRLMEVKWSAVVCLHLAGKQWNGHWVHDAQLQNPKNFLQLTSALSCFHHDLPVGSCRLHSDATEAANDLATLTSPSHQTSAKADFHYMRIPRFQILLKFMLTKVHTDSTSTSISRSVQREWLWVAKGEGEQSNSCLHVFAPIL